MPKWIAPPLWLVAALRLFQSRIGASSVKIGCVRVGVVDGEPAELVVLAGRPRRRAGIGVGVIQVDEVVRAEVGVEGDAEQPAFALRVDVQVERGPGRAVAADELDVPRLFEHEQPAVGGELHRGGAAQVR